MDSINGLYNFIVNIAEHGPLGVHAFLVGMFMAWSTALMLRWWHPATMPPATRGTLVRVAQFVVGLAITWGFWTTTWGFFIGIINGTFAPIVWDIALAIADWKFPRIARALRGRSPDDGCLPVRPLTAVPPPDGDN